MSVSVMVEYATLFARRVATRVPDAFSRPKERLDDWPTMTSPGSGNPVSRQWPLESTSAGSESAELGKRMTEPEQLLRDTVPARVTAFRVGAVPVSAVVAGTDARAAAGWEDAGTAWGAGAATAGAAPAPASTRANRA